MTLITSNAGHKDYCELDDDRYWPSFDTYDPDYGYYKSADDGPEILYDGNIQVAVDQWIFNRTGAIERFGTIEEWDTSRVTHMWNLFQDQRTFNDDISNWNTACVTTMEGMFRG